MTTKFGIEIEFVGMGSYLGEISDRLAANGFDARDESYNHETRNHWKLVRDGSVYTGAELVSPPLAFTPESLDNVDSAFAALTACGAEADNSCGIHVHVDATWLRAYSRTNRDAFFQFVTAAFQANESSFDMLVKSHRATNNSWCKSTVGKTHHNLLSDRYHKLNLASYVRHGTIEFRQLQGTMNARAVRAWITLCVTFLANCRKRFEAALAPTATSLAAE